MTRALYDQVQAESRVLELETVRAEKASLENDCEVVVSRANKLEINLAKTKKVVIQLQKELE